MYISIQHFLEKGIKKLEQYEKKFLNNPMDIASFVFGITDELHKLGLEIIKSYQRNTSDLFLLSIWFVF